MIRIQRRLQSGDEYMAAGSTALRLYVAVMRPQYFLHYPHGLSRSMPKLLLASCVSGFFRERELPRTDSRARGYVFTGLVLMSSGPTAIPILAAASHFSRQSHSSMQETSVQDSGSSKIGPTQPLLCRNPRKRGRQGNSNTLEGGHMYINLVIYIACLAFALTGGIIAYALTRLAERKSVRNWTIIDGEYFRRKR